jgi:hypothetical protein
MEYSLSMTFINTAGDKVSMTISGVKDSLAKAEVTALMDTIISNDVFTSKGGALVSKYDAQLTQRQTTKIDVQ